MYFFFANGTTTVGFLITVLHRIDLNSIEIFAKIFMYLTIELRQSISLDNIIYLCILTKNCECFIFLQYAEIEIKLTGNNHHAYSKNPLVVSFSGNVTKPDGCHTRHCKI